MPVRLVVAVLAAGVLLTAAAPAGAARTATVGPGFGPGIAVDPAGTAYAAWKFDDGSESSPVIRFCTLARNASGCAAPPVALPFVNAYNVGAVGVLLPAPGVVDVVTGRNDGSDQSAQLARSTDGGRTFGPSVRLGGSTEVDRVALLPDGRVAVAGGALKLAAAPFRSDGADGGSEAPVLSEELNGQSGADVAGLGGDVYAAGSTSTATPTTTRAFRLPAGANPFDGTSWQPLPPQRGGRVRLAAGPAGLVALLDTAPTRVGRVVVQRLEGSTWSPPVDLGGESYEQDIDQDAAGRLHMVGARSSAGGVLTYTRSDDGGALWSQRTALTGAPLEAFDLGLAVGPDGRGASIQSTEAPENQPIRVRWIEPRRVPQATVQVGDAFVQVRSRCRRGREVNVEARASRGGRRVAVGTVLRSATFSGRGARVRTQRRHTARLRLRRSTSATTVRARLRPRSGAVVRAAFRAVGCRGGM